MIINCCMCGRFVSTADSRRHVEMGDYGTIYSVEFECPPDKGCNARCFEPKRGASMTLSFVSPQMFAGASDARP